MEAPPASFSWKKNNQKTKENSYTLETQTLDLFDLIRSSEMKHYFTMGGRNS